MTIAPTATTSTAITIDAQRQKDFMPGLITRKTGAKVLRPG